eukprot:c5884_g1_i1 orf=152-319(+)
MAPWRGPFDQGWEPCLVSLKPWAIIGIMVMHALKLRQQHFPHQWHCEENSSFASK